MNDWDLDEKPLSKWQVFQLINLLWPFIYLFLDKEWQIILGLHLVLVLLHGRFTTSNEQDK